MLKMTPVDSSDEGSETDVDSQSEGEEVSPRPAAPSILRNSNGEELHSPPVVFQRRRNGVDAKLFAVLLPLSWTEEQVRSLFSQYGGDGCEVTGLEVKKTQKAAEHGQCAIIQFAYPEHAQMAKNACSGMTVWEMNRSKAWTLAVRWHKLNASLFVRGLHRFLTSDQLFQECQKVTFLRNKLLYTQVMCSFGSASSEQKHLEGTGNGILHFSTPEFAKAALIEFQGSSAGPLRLGEDQMQHPMYVILAGSDAPLQVEWCRDYRMDFMTEELPSCMKEEWTKVQAWDKQTTFVTPSLKNAVDERSLRDLDVYLQHCHRYNADRVTLLKKREIMEALAQEAKRNLIESDYSSERWRRVVREVHDHNYAKF